MTTDLLSPSPQPETLARTGQRFPHVRALDGLRGVAVLTVVLYHFAPGIAPGGFLGVDLFFVLSGYLITSLLVTEWSATRQIRLATFWLRRARRLLPALLLVLAAVGVYELVHASRVEAHHVGSDGLWSMVYLANWHFIYSGQSYIQQFLYRTPSPLRHMWSLAIEEQFYLAWPLLVAGVGAIAKQRRLRTLRQYQQFRALLLLLCAGLGAASFARMLMLYSPGADPSRVYYGTDSRAFIVLVGASLGVLSAGTPVVRHSRRAPLIGLGIAAALVLGIMTTSLTTSSRFLYEGGYGLIAVIMVVVLAAAAQPGANPLARLFEWRPLVGLGLISYGVYLWHWPIGLWVTSANSGLDGPGLFVLRCALTLAAALASYCLVEMPIRRGALGRLGHTRRVVVPAVLALGVAGVLVVPAAAFPSVATPPSRVKLTAGATGVTAAYASSPRCDGGPAPEPVDPSRTLRVELEGNSIAGEIEPCLRAILQSRHVSLEGVTPAGYLMCDAIPGVEKQVGNRATHPDAAIVFAAAAHDERCGTPWHWPIDKLISIWKKARTHVYLVASVPFVRGTGVGDPFALGAKAEDEYYRRLARSDPQHITYVDAGRFIRDADGSYVWRMPCVSGGEAGCDQQHTVGVRYIDGFHFCTDPAYASRVWDNGVLRCDGTEHQAGARRVAASVASGLLPSLRRVESLRARART
jgi:peptidoglycan/LPS O-acetylase OafA/YrhL